MTPRIARLAAAAVAVPVLAVAAATPAQAFAVPTRHGGPWLDTQRPSATATLASATQSTGVVLIDTQVDYGAGEAAGTGMVLSSDGTVVTNHHVVEGSTQVEVTDPATNRTYRADVVGYEPETDVAVLKLQDASGLSTIATDTAPVHEGDKVTAVGNSNGRGVLTAADGRVTDTGANITVSNDNGRPQPLTDLIEIDATVVPGDSGGALLDSDGEVVGMNVAADSAGTTGYAIPISTVLGLADQILSGDDSGAVALGYGPALGLQLSERNGDLLVLGVVDGGAADQAGVTRGSIITALDGQRVTSYADLVQRLGNHRPGDSVQLSWLDADGSHTATTTLGRAPLA